jgi:predicted lipid-binding transport protein (Tim44 family)
MKRIVLGAAIAVLGAMLVATEAEARRIGGGRTVGAQRNITTAPPAQTPAKPAQQVAPQQQPAAQPGAAPAAGQPAAASGLSRWMPMLGGLAIGGLLGSLFAGSGFGALLAGVLMAALLAFGVLVLVRLLAARRGEAPRPVQFAGLGNETVAAPPPSQASGFDLQAGARSTSGSAVAAGAARIPEGFDTASFLRGAKLNFMKLQLANDAGNLDELREFTTPELFDEMARDVRERGSARQQTDIMALSADLLEVVTEGDRHWASVRFAGSVRETPGSAPEGFEEVWNLAKPVDGSSGWVLAGIQQMH